MLFDKSYYDYDFENVKEKPVLTEEDKEIWSQDRLNAILGVKRKVATAEELQADIIGVKDNEKVD